MTPQQVRILAKKILLVAVVFLCGVAIARVIPFKESIEQEVDTNQPGNISIGTYENISVKNNNSNIIIERKVIHQYLQLNNQQQQQKQPPKCYVICGELLE